MRREEEAPSPPRSSVFNRSKNPVGCAKVARRVFRRRPEYRFFSLHPCGNDLKSVNYERGKR